MFSYIQKGNMSKDNELYYNPKEESPDLLLENLAPYIPYIKSYYHLVNAPARSKTNYLKIILPMPLAGAVAPKREELLPWFHYIEFEYVRDFSTDEFGNRIAGKLKHLAITLFFRDSRDLEKLIKAFKI